ncbi:MAG: helix-turn-helix domain-containing protein [Oscillospiraceae bacterium]|nr:helix-turn-helix domain-containing protein [Oscillospiraceae bacterium]
MQKLRQDVNMGKNLRILRMKAQLTQSQVAAKLQVSGSDITRSVYSRYETGELNIKASDLIRLKKIFYCQYDDFFVGLLDES